MLRLCSIASGRKGNCIFVSGEHSSLIIDAGVCLSRIGKAVTALGAAPHDILLTHTHSDHYRYVPDAVARLGMTVHGPCSLAGAVRADVGDAFEPFYGDFHVGDITVSAFPVSHDVPCCGYSLYSDGSKISVVTDLGIMPSSTLESISDSDAVLIESNYDPDMLRANPAYPAYLKARIAGNRGHLSNPAASECVAYLASKGVRHIMLGHLSENNNTPDAALSSARRALAECGLTGKTRLYVASQSSASEVIEV